MTIERVDEAEKLIWFWNRKEAREEVEQVYGDAVLQWVYGTKVGQSLADQILSKPFLSHLYGLYQSSRFSGHKIQPFIEKFKIPMEDFEEKPYLTFNEFFIRKFKPGVRVFVKDPQSFPAFSEARYLAYERIEPDQTFPVKGQMLSAQALLGQSDFTQRFEGGPLLLARLCPTDYHRFHFPDQGKVLKSYRIHGDLHSVNPLALKYKNEIFMTNERNVSILETQHFGKLAYIEVGALCVGKIVQTHTGNQEFNRGDEKGYFLFGGSTVIVLGEAGKWRPDRDLLQQTALGRETLVQLGERVAVSMT